MLQTISGWVWQVEWFLQNWNDHFCSNLQIKRGTVQPCHFSEKNIGWLKFFCRALSTDQLLHLQPSSSSSSAGEKLTWFWIQCFMIVYLWVICVCFQSNPYSKPIRVEHIWTSWGLQRIQENQGLWGLSGNHWRWFGEPHRLGTNFRSRNVPIGFDIPNRLAWSVSSLTGFRKTVFCREKKFPGVFFHIEPIGTLFWPKVHLKAMWNHSHLQHTRFIFGTHFCITNLNLCMYLSYCKTIYKMNF